MLARLSHPTLRFILFFLLALTLAVPAKAFAASPSRAVSATADPTLVSSYKSDVITTTDKKNVVVTLSLYDDNSFELQIESQDDNTSTVGYGTYEQSDAAVSLTIVGADKQDFDKAIDLKLTPNDDGTLTIPGSKDGLMGEDDIILTSVEAGDESADSSDTSDITDTTTSDESSDITDTTTTDESSDVTDTTTEESSDVTDTTTDESSDITDTTTEESSDITDTTTAESGEETTTTAPTVGGAYVSPVQPSNSNKVGVVYLLNLLPDGSASLNTDPLNLHAPIFELGTWTDNGDETVSLEITGTVDSTYDKPIDLTFGVTADGVLTTETTLLFPLTLLNPDMGKGGKEGEQSGENSGKLDDTGKDTHIYVAAVTLPDKSEPTNIYLLLYNDGTVELTDEAQTDTLSGEWTMDGTTLSVTIKSNKDGALDTPVAMAFEQGDDGALTATDYPKDVFGDEAPVFNPTGPNEGSSSAKTNYSIYESDQLPSKDTDGMVATVILGDDGTGLMSIDMMDGKEPPLQYGTWAIDDSDVVTLTINEDEKGKLDEPLTFTFQEDKDNLTLTLTDESSEVFGDTDVVLKHVEENQ